MGSKSKSIARKAASRKKSRHAGNRTRVLTGSSVGGNSKRSQFKRFKNNLKKLAASKTYSKRSTYLSNCKQAPALIGFTQSACSDLAKNLQISSPKVRRFFNQAKNKAGLNQAKKSAAGSKRLILKGGSVFKHIIQGIGDIFSGDWF